MSICCMGRADPTQFRKEAAVFRCGFVCVWPGDESRQSVSQSRFVPLARRAPLDAGPEFSEDWHADSNAVSLMAFLAGTVAHAVAAVDEILGNARVEEVAPHGRGPSSICRRTASML